jgi:uncharacterized membrane protein YhhN
MKKKISGILVIIFFLLLLIDLISLSAGLQSIHFFTKPLLMPVLGIFLFYRLSKNPSTSWYFTIAGILLAWAGDVFLLFEQKNPSFFLFGLASFLGTHICYILLFRKLTTSADGWWKKNAWLWIAVVLYGIILIAILWESLGGMKIPVIVYALCISIMVILSLRLQSAMPKAVWIYFSIGAFLFFISDSILALNKFLQPVDFAAPAIMLTYGLAQFLIVAGTVKYFGAKTAGED